MMGAFKIVTIYVPIVGLALWINHIVKKKAAEGSSPVQEGPSSEDNSWKGIVVGVLAAGLGMAILVGIVKVIQYVWNWNFYV